LSISSRGTGRPSNRRIERRETIASYASIT
jgi:hypothetical protein